MDGVDREIRSALQQGLLPVRRDPSRVRAELGRRRRAAGRRWRAVSALVAAVVVVVGGVGAVVTVRGGVDQSAVSAGRDAGGADLDPGGGSAASSPFRVGWVPEGFQPFIAGRGTDRQMWSEDCCGSQEPFVVLAPVGQSVVDDYVVVSVTGYAGYQSGLAQATAAPWDENERFELDGRQAIFSGRPAAGDIEGEEDWSDLVVAHEPDLAVRVIGKGSRDDLAAIASRVQPRGEHQPPGVEPPEGMAVVGHSAADFIVALQASASLRSAEVPGPESAYGAAWVHEDSKLFVMTVPGVAGDLDALAGLTHFRVGTAATSDVTVAGRSAVLVESALIDCDPSPCPVDDRLVVTRMSSGDLLVVRATGQPVVESRELLRLADTVAPLDLEGWETFVEVATGGPGLQPDPQAVELARGAVEGSEWLLQAISASGHEPVNEDVYDATDEDASGMVADSCLKTTTGRACAGNALLSWSSWGGLAYTSLQPHPTLGHFMVLTSNIEAATVRVTTGDDVATAPMTEVPGNVPRWAGVVFVARPGHPTCDPPPNVGDVDIARVELLDEGGRIVQCLDGGPGL